MWLVLLFHGIYVIDLFYNEDWYLRTIDIAHDHFGWYFAYGDSVFLPFMYTLQSHFLLRNPIQLSNIHVLLILFVASLGYWVFRTTNNQRDLVRKTKGDCKIWY